MNKHELSIMWPIAVLLLALSIGIMAPLMYVCCLQREELQKQVDNCLVCNQPDNLKPLLQCNTCVIKPGRVLSDDNRNYEWCKDCRGTGVHRKDTIGAIRYGIKNEYPYLEIGKIRWEKKIQ